MSIHVGSILPIGTVIHSMLTVSQFASEYGNNWVLSDGSSVSGSAYHTLTGFSVTPDMRGLFLRGKGASGNPDGDLALGTYSADKVISHTHGAPSSPTGGGSYGLSGTESGSAPIQTQAYGGNETAPRSVTVNIFIRIN